MASPATSPIPQPGGFEGVGVIEKELLADRAASTELPFFNCHTGRPVAKFRKWVPIGFGTPVVL